MRRIAIFSDIHGNIYALQDIIQNLKKEKVDEGFLFRRRHWNRS